MGALTLLKAGVFSSAFNPISLGNLRAWYKADAGITLNGSTVSQWNDQSGYNNHLKQSTAANQPTYTTGAINSLPALSFDGTNDSMQLDATITGFGSMTFFIVYKRTANTSQAVLSNGASTYMYLQYGSSFYIGNNAKSAAMTTNVWYLRAGTGKNDGTGTEYFSNGASLGTIAGGTNVFDAFRYIATAGGAPLQGLIAEILIFDRVLNSTDMGQINSYLNGKYAIY